VTPTPPEAEPPLARLFAIGYRSLVDGLHTELTARGWTDVRPAFGFVLLAARRAPTTVTELADLMGTTKQAASKLVDAMDAARYVRRTSGRQDARQRPVELTARGVRLLEAVEQIYRDLEAEWAEIVGHDELARVRLDLVRMLSDRETGRLPPVRPTW
jgi:DNA-binding MarR family transcriptional regulator